MMEAMACSLMSVDAGVGARERVMKRRMKCGFAEEATEEGAIPAYRVKLERATLHLKRLTCESLIAPNHNAPICLLCVKRLSSTASKELSSASRNHTVPSSFHDVQAGRAKVPVRRVQSRTLTSRTALRLLSLRYMVSFANTTSLFSLLCPSPCSPARSCSEVCQLHAPTMHDRVVLPPHQTELLSSYMNLDDILFISFVSFHEPVSLRHFESDPSATGPIRGAAGQDSLDIMLPICAKRPETDNENRSLELTHLILAQPCYYLVGHVTSCAAQSPPTSNGRSPRQ